MRLAFKADKTVDFRIKKYYVGKRGLRKEANPNGPGHFIENML